MKKAIIIIVLITGVFSSVAQSVKVMNYDELEQRLNQKNDSIYLVNFWATWCKPCIEELPDFLKISTKFKDEKMKLILVSLDFSNHIEQRVIPFLQENNITEEVIVLDDPDANTWINKVDPSWDGAIPVSLVLHKGKKQFYKSTLSYDELHEIIKPLTKN